MTTWHERLRDRPLPRYPFPDLINPQADALAAEYCQWIDEDYAFHSEGARALHKRHWLCDIASRGFPGLTLAELRPIARCRDRRHRSYGIASMPSASMSTVDSPPSLPGSSTVICGQPRSVAQREAPESRVVYVDRDSMVLAHAHQLLRGTPEGATRYVQGELREPEAILAATGETLDFSRPVAVVIFGVLHLFSGDDDPRGVVGRITAPLAAGSYLALSHLARDVEGKDISETFSRLNAMMAESCCVPGMK